MHSLVGTFITIATIVESVKAFIAVPGWNFGPHTGFGIALLAVALAVWFSGVVGALLGKFKVFYKPWQHHKEVHTKILKFHSLAGKVNLALAYVTTSSGLILYQKRFYADDPDISLALPNMVFFTVFTILIEVIY